MVETEGMLNTRTGEYDFIERSIPIFPQNDLDVPAGEKAYIKVRAPFCDKLSGMICTKFFGRDMVYMSCICETACFPVNYKEPMPQHSLQLWKECGQLSCKALNGYRSLNMVNGLGQIPNSHCQDCLSQSEAFPPLSPGRSTVKPGA